MLLAPKGNVAGAKFTVPISRQVRITVKDSTAKRILINKLDGAIVRTFTESDISEALYLEQGDYVLSLIANPTRSGRASIMIR